MGIVITVSNWKGGVGKTTIEVLLAEIAAARGKKVLIIDLDSNCAMSQVYDKILMDYTSMKFLSNVVDGEFNDIYPVKDGIDIIPGDLKNSLINNISDNQLRNNLRRSGLRERYDYILLDPPGYWGSHTRNSVFAADVLIVPGACSRLDLEATKLYFRTLQENFVEAECLVVVNAFSRKTNLAGIYEKYQAEFGGFLMPESIPLIPSLRKLTDDANYALNPAVRATLEKFVDRIIGGKNA